MRLRTWILTVLVLLTAAYSSFFSSVSAVPLRKPLAQIPLELGEWKGVSSAMDEEIVQAVGVEDYLMREYRNRFGRSISIYVGYYEQQKEGDQIHSPKHCLPGAGWRPLESTVVSLETPGINNGNTKTNRYVVGKGTQKQMALYWYQSRGRNITNEYFAKVYLVLDSIFRKRNDGALVRFMTLAPENESMDDTQNSMEDFARVFLPELKKMLPE